MARSNRRGQAAVEMALGSLIFVTVLIFGIHFAEVGYLGQKAQQANATALWDATSRRVTKIAPTPTKAPFSKIFSGSNAVDTDANQRYRDFDAVQKLKNRGITQVFTRARPPNVVCRPVSKSDAVESRIRFAPSPTTSKVFFDVGGAVCSASEAISGLRIPRSFLDAKAGSKPFHAQHYKRTQPIVICAMGRADKNGNCQGEYAILLGDWALSNRSTNENDECKLAGCQNKGYHDAVQSMYVGAGGGAAAFAATWAGGVPASGAEFWMSYAGEESNYLQYVSGHPVGGSYNTGGTFKYTNGNKCFLGKGGC